jgi:hypothetical protein|tara:strand:- start:995 stop:1900 length:906 start_codon:yes stop_codon:yes gene_type:complete
MPSEFEKETHFVDARGRKRKRKVARSIAEPASAAGARGQRTFTETEKELIVMQYNKMKAQAFGELSYGEVARKLQSLHPTIFGEGATGMPNGGLSRQTVRNMAIRADKGEIPDGRGRPNALPEVLLVTILAAFSAVVSVRATLISAPMLQPIAIACILAGGYGSLLRDGRRKRGVFCCGLDFVRDLMKANGWKCVRPSGDARKLPLDWPEKRWLMVLRLAFFVLVHEIPRALGVNFDHSAIMTTQVKGKMWITEQMAKAKDKSVNNHGDKRCFTVTSGSTTEGEMLPHQVIVTGSTAGALP